MKRIIIATLALASFLAGQAQLTFGLHGTGNLSGARLETAEDLNVKKKMRTMPGAGIDLQFAVHRNLAIRSGLNYIQNGITANTEIVPGGSVKLKVENTLHYLQVPVNLLYTLNVARIQLFAGGGGFVNYGVSGKSKATQTQVEDGHQTITIGETDVFKKDGDGFQPMKKTDFGVGVLGGVRLGAGLFANVGYQFSLANIDNGDDKSIYRNRGLQLTIGYFF